MEKHRYIHATSQIQDDIFSVGSWGRLNSQSDWLLKCIMGLEVLSQSKNKETPQSEHKRLNVLFKHLDHREQCFSQNIHCAMLLWESNLNKTDLYINCMSLQFPTNDKGLFGLCSMFVVPRWATGCIDGSFGGTQQRRLGFTLAGGPFPGRKTQADRGQQPVQRSLTASTLNKQTQKRSQRKCLEQENTWHNGNGPVKWQ